MDKDFILQMEHITKLFPGVKALDDVTIQVRRGEIHALVGENGARKSTLMKVLSGVYPYNSYSGSIIVNGQVQQYTNMRDSEKAGIAIVYQELNIVGNLSIYENIFLGHELQKNGVINRQEQIGRSFALLKDVGLAEEPTNIISNIGVGKQQLVEIARALNKNAAILILDEPTAALTEADADNLLRLLDILRKKGITCIYISHKLNEVFRVADTITILRDGKTVKMAAVKDIDQKEVVTHMVGHEMTEFYPWKKREPSDVMFEVKHWNILNPSDPSKHILKDINISARKGEIVGIVGLMGAGRTELAMSLFGAFSSHNTGELFIDGKKTEIQSPKQAVKAGLSYVSEDRKRYGLILGADVRRNMSLANLRMISRLGMVDKNAEIKQTFEYMKSMNIRCSSIEQLLGNLSGGNQQKVILAKWLLTKSKVLILDEPTRGIDVGAKYEIYQIISSLVDQGICVIMISSELTEVLGMSDRIYVMRGGEVVAEMTRDEATQENIMTYAATEKKDERGVILG
ncbi:MAG: ATP-binding cassette domain-containing protein [Clostridiales bacterium]|jgi:D-xylose transport system ATP-binding protein|nr:ATP-binding cassette domain-containing protein [Clostridiales bacterium]